MLILVKISLDKLGDYSNKINKTAMPFSPMRCIAKEEKILKGSLDSIQSPSTPVKIQIMGGKVCFRHRGKTLLGIALSTNFLYSKVC